MITLREPTQCHLWTEERLVPEDLEVLETVRRIIEAPQVRREIKECRQCGQLFFYQLVEIVDNESADDAEYHSYAPVTTEQDIFGLALNDRFVNLECRPQLHFDDIKGRERLIFWVR